MVTAQIDISGVSILYFDIGAYIDGNASIPGDVRNILTHDEYSAAQRFARQRDCSRAMLSRYLLRRLLASKLDVAASAVALEIGEFGKPRLGAGHSIEIQFNVSHSGSLIAICTANHPVGIDVEVHAPLGDIAALCRDCMSIREQQLILAQPEEKRSRAFLEIWTRKEAVLKACGRGLSMPLKSISVVDDQDFDQGWKVVNISSPAGYIAALATPSSFCTPSF